MVAGGGLGGEKSGCSSHPMAAEAGFNCSTVASQMTGSMAGWNATAFVSNALSRMLCGVVWQQP